MTGVLLGPTKGPLQVRADDLLARLRKNPTRGDVVAAIQVAVIETLEAMAAEMCVICRESPGETHGGDHPSAAALHPEPPDPCGADELWSAFHKVKTRLWEAK